MKALSRWGRMEKRKTLMVLTMVMLLIVKFLNKLMLMIKIKKLLIVEECH